MSNLWEMAGVVCAWMTLIGAVLWRHISVTIDKKILELKLEINKQDESFMRTAECHFPEVVRELRNISSNFVNLDKRVTIIEREIEKE